jgi:katanin p60 ATPase-containing subunit A1
LLAKAVATECGTTFFNISSSSITSKYRGDSEKLIRTLFQLAQYYAPSTIFIDEVDSLMSHRDGADESGSEASRRLKSELLIQLDGLSKSEQQVFVLCASNLPWDLDGALLRRLEKRILVPLPNENARSQLIQLHLTKNDRAAGLDYTKLAQLTDNYSGSDIVSLCKEAAMRPVRRLMASLMSTNENLAEADIDPSIELERVSMRDVEAALLCTKPSAAVRDLAKYEEWHQEHGATIELADANNA